MNVEPKKIKELKMDTNCIKNMNSTKYIKGPNEYKLIKQKILHRGGKAKKTRKLRRTRRTRRHRKTKNH